MRRFATANDLLVRPRPKRRRIFPLLIERLKNSGHAKLSVEIAEITGATVRSAERYLAHDRLPDAEAAVKLLLSRHGADLIELAVTQLPVARQRPFWRQMELCVLRARLREAEQDGA